MFSDYLCPDCANDNLRVELKPYGKNGKLRCPLCGLTFEPMEAILASDYDFDHVEQDDGTYKKIDLFSDITDNDEIPEGCRACGGPYPSCKTSCKLFDD